MSTKSATVLPLRDYRARRRQQFFTRAELNQLLGLYSRHVSRGVWRDYAIDFDRHSLQAHDNSPVTR